MSAEPATTEPDNTTAKHDAERTKRRRSRSIAIALILVGMAVLFYVITILKLSSSGEIPQI